MTFADEVKATVKAKPAVTPKAADKPADTVPLPIGEVKTAVLSVPEKAAPTEAKDHFAIPVEKAAQPAVEATPAKAAEQPAPEAPKKVIKIGQKEFTDPQEAIDYAKELAQQSAEDKAYIEGVKDASAKAEPEETAPEETAYEKFSKDIFVDPVKAAQEFEAAIEQKIVDRYNAAVREQTAQQAAVKARADAWDNFYKANPDLSSPSLRQIAESYTDVRNTEKWNIVKDLTPAEGFKKIAELARAEVAALKKALLPTEELASGPVMTTGASGDQVSATTQKNSEKPVDFIAALNSIRARGKTKTSGTR